MYYATDQLYKILTLRHRNNQMILKFLIFWQQFGWNPYCFPRIENEDILDSEYLPPLLEGLDHGVIWIPLKSSKENDDTIEEKINDIFREIKEVTEISSSVAILYDENKELAKRIKNLNKKFFGPYEEFKFNGREADIVIHVSSIDLDIQTLSRARRLLIVVSDQDYHNQWTYGSENFKAMNIAVKNNLVKKV